MPNPFSDDLLNRKFTRKEFLGLSGIAIASVFGVVGIARELLSHASTPTASIEPESGTITGNAARVSDTSASVAAAVSFGGATASTGYSDASPPWVLKTGESVDDNRPAGVNVVNYENYSNNGARSFGQTLAAIRSAATAPYFVRMAAGTYHVTDFSFASGVGAGRGYQDVNSAKYFGGLIGAGADKTFVVMDPNVLTSDQLSGIANAGTAPVGVSVIYAGGSGLSIATFFSGITFRGNFQQITTLSGLSGTAPAPYSGIYLASVKPGSMVQYCRFQGFGFTAKASPPYELGAIESLHSSWTLRRTEVDGRIAKEINSAQPVSSGGVMWNYETNVKAIDSWLHYSRRSGWATHDHAPSEGSNANDLGVYYSDNFQVEHIADTPDNYAGTSLSFNTSNVEEVHQTFTYIRPRFTVSNGVHINLGTSGTNALAHNISVTDPIIGNTTYNSCLVIGITKSPNSYGNSPYYTLYQSSGLAALPFTVTANGKALAPIISTAFNASTHTPDKNYIVAIG